ncbi:MAG: hypothetical protein ACJ72N_21970 [Labedaea sp.]
MNLVTIVVGLLCSVVILVGAGAYYRGFAKAKAAEATIALLEKLANTRAQRIDDLEGESARFEEKATALAGNQLMLEQQNRDLRDLVTGATAVHALGTELQCLLEERTADLARILETTGRDLRELLRQHADAMAKRLARLEQITSNTALTVSGRPPPPPAPEVPDDQTP